MIRTYHLSVLAMIHTASETGSSTTECCEKKIIKALLSIVCSLRLVKCHAIATIFMAKNTIAKISASQTSLKGFSFQAGDQQFSSSVNLLESNALPKKPYAFGYVSALHQKYFPDMFLNSVHLGKKVLLADECMHFQRITHNYDDGQRWELSYYSPAMQALGQLIVFLESHFPEHPEEPSLANNCPQF